MKLVLFDCDGTLVDSAGLIHEVMARTFVAFDLPRPQLAETKAIIGLTLDGAIARMLGQATIDDRILAMTAHYKSIYATVRTEPGLQEPLFDGISAMMAALAVRGDIVIGAVTGKSRRGLDLIAATHGFSDIIKVSRTADDCPSKPHPAMVLECCAESGIAAGDTLVVGDAVFDIEMARAAGASSLAVSWGYGDERDLMTAGAAGLARSAKDIVSFVEAWHGGHS